MKSGSPLDPLAASMFHATTLGLLPTFFTPGGARSRETVDGAPVRPPIALRPAFDQIEFVMFAQTWGSNAVGFGGIGTSAMTKAYTVVAIGPQEDACVYFDGRLAYHLEKQTDEFRADLRERCMPSVAQAHERYAGSLVVQNQSASGD